MGITASFMATAFLGDRGSLSIYRPNRDRLSASYSRLALAAAAMSENFDHDPEADEVQFGLALEFDAALVDLRAAQERFAW